MGVKVVKKTFKCALALAFLSTSLCAGTVQAGAQPLDFGVQSGVQWGVEPCVQTSAPVASDLLAKADVKYVDTLQADAFFTARVMQQQSGLLESGQAVEDCIYGRISFSKARKIVRLVLQNGDATASEMERYQAKSPSHLGAAAIKLWAAQRKVLVKTDDLLATGKVERPALKEFQSESEVLTKGVVSVWLDAKLARAQAGKTAAPQGAQAYYAWSCQTLPIQKNLCNLNGRLLAMSSDSANGKRITASSAQALRQDIMGQLRLLEAMQPAASVAQAHKCLIAEVKALDRLTEAVVLLDSDPTPDASSRLERCNRALRGCSLQSGIQNLEALKACCNVAKGK